MSANGKTDKKLTLKQEKFCQLYASDEEFFCNGVQAYIEAYNPKRHGNWYNSAMASASRLLRNVNILNRIDEILDLKGLNDSFVDKQLELLITQNADFKTKLGSIKEYNKLKKRITEKREIEHTVLIPDEESREKADNVINDYLNGDSGNTKRKG